ncbi:MAG: hypothetical protein DHS20C21_17610 [Gemmatimonadota bacterium]|nr:MAG: hypothetical protein DHS20C21_17610 [Gemmatimonadota bacterium]
MKRIDAVLWPTLLVLLSLGTAGCRSAGDSSLGIGPSDDPSTLARTAQPRSFFILQHADVRSSQWPTEYQDVELFVCNPALSAADIAKVRRDIPDAKLLAYLNAQEVAIHRFSGDYYEALTARFDSSMCIIDLAEDRILFLEEDDHPAFVLNQDSADVLVAFHRDVTMAMDWDGLYIDQCTLRFPVSKKRLLEEADTEYDINGDGVADTYEELEIQYETWRPYFTSELRRVVRRNVASAPRGARNKVILLGNAGGPLADPALNGLTLEGIGVAYSPFAAIEWALAQEAVSVSPKMTGGWIRLPVSVIPTTYFANEVNGYLGDIYNQDIGTPQEF